PVQPGRFSTSVGQVAVMVCVGETLKTELLPVGPVIVIGPLGSKLPHVLPLTVRVWPVALRVSCLVKLL
ncbi:MAG TPA: hypothetical protein VI318_13895, partial [Baekduia sp.]